MTIEAIKNNIAELNNSKYPDGTYNLETLVPMEFDSGFQVSHCNIGDDYTDSELMDIIDFLSYIGDGVVYLGKFDGTAEISYHIMNHDEAVKVAKAYNQISVWDWETMTCEATGGTGEK